MHPFFPVGWRALLIVPIAIAAVAKTLATFASIVQPYLAIHYDVRFELGMVIGQVLFQWCFLVRKPWTDKLDYAFLLVGISSLGAALLWPLLLWHRFAGVGPDVAVAYFACVVMIMFGVHLRLVKLRRLPGLLSLTWVCYRLIILFVVVRRPSS